MLNKFINYIAQEGLCYETDNILLAISGGVDSISMMHLFLKAGYKIQLAHVNYKMRGSESDADEEMVKAMGKHHNIISHVITFPEHLKEKGNFQETARNFRYDWFQKLCEENGLNKIATAHHKDDILETFFINLFRGSGLKGLSSIQNKNGNVIRPMLTFTKEEIYQYAELNNIYYREDLSNTKDDYLRNFIRIKLLNDIKTRSEQYIEGIGSSIRNINRSQHLLMSLIGDQYLQKLDDDSWIIHYEKMNHIADKALLLYYILKEFGFNIHQTEDIATAELLSAKIENDVYVIARDRSGYLIRKKTNVNQDVMVIEGTGDYVFNERMFRFDLVDTEEHGLNYSEPKTQYLGFENYPFPLIIRIKQDGDAFKPFGMNGVSQSLKKYFVDHKFSITEKENSLVIAKEAVILSLFPYRIAEHCRVKEQSKYVVRVKEVY